MGRAEDKADNESNTAIGKVTFEEPLIEHIVVASAPRRRLASKSQISSSSLSPNSGEIDTPRLKEVKRGYRSFSHSKVCGVSFERLPAWLWVLRLVEWSDIVVSRIDKGRLRHASPELFARYGSRWRVAANNKCHHPMACEAVVWWVSGTLTFVNSLRFPGSVPVVCWITNAPRRTPGGNTTPHQWLSISHAKVGGATTARGVFRLTGTDHINIPGDLTRTLSYVIKFSVRSTSCPAAFAGDHYTLTSKLSVQRLDIPIVVPSDFSATGWGQRLL